MVETLEDELLLFTGIFSADLARSFCATGPNPFQVLLQRIINLEIPTCSNPIALLLWVPIAHLVGTSVSWKEHKG